MHRMLSATLDIIQLASLILLRLVRGINKKRDMVDKVEETHLLKIKEIDHNSWSTSCILK